MLLGRRGRVVVTHSARGYVDEDVDGDEVVALFGNARADLRDAVGSGQGTRYPEHLEPVAIFGTVDLMVPGDWTVDVETVRIFGDVEDRRRNPGRDDEADLVLSGAAIFGDVVIRE